MRFAARNRSANMDNKNTPPESRPRPTPRAHTLAWQGAANRVARGVLRTPLLCRVVGNWLMTIYVVGRKSGRRYPIPVAYVRHNEYLVVGTQFGWGRNLRTGEPVQIRLKGKRRTADVQVITDEAGVVRNYAIMARGNHRFATFNEIGLDEAGDPNPTDLHLAWAAGARAFRFTPR
jgi:deazaflavin-dependent oxidoreductase (nitroreductase family)